MAKRLSDRARRATALIASVLLVGSGAVWLAAPATAAACTTVGGFEIDGNLDGGTCGGVDFSNAGGVAQTTSSGTYNVVADNSNSGTWSNGGGTPPKVSFDRVYATTRTVGSNYFAYVGWERPQNKGTGGYAIEIDNAATRVGPDQAPQPDRSAGGYVFFITTHGGDAPVLGQSCAFTSQADYPGVCSTGTTGFAAAVNGSSITDPFTGSSVASGKFLEVGLDVTQLTGKKPACPPASTVASLYLRSFTGEDSGPTGNIKGYVAPLEVKPASSCVDPGVSTAATPGGDMNPRGTAQSDVATLTAPVGSGLPAPAGTVDFYLCAPAQVTAAGCPSGAGTKIGATKTLAGGVATSDNTTAAQTQADGKYCWRIAYTPGTPTTYNAATHTNADSECFTVVHGTPDVSTQIQVTGANAPGLGFTTLGDTATFTGVVGTPVAPNATVDFSLYGPYATGVTPTCSGDPAFTTTGTLTAAQAAGTFTATTADTFAPKVVGKYVWVASWAGDALNDGVTETCDAPNESSTVIGAQVDVTKSASTKVVSAGQTIGFDITVSNTGAVPATGVTVTDVLPTNAGLNWTIDPLYTGCSIDAGVLTCTLGQVAPNSELTPIHLSSPTTPATCGTVNNKATVSTTNGTGGDSDTASITVNCPSLSIDKTADAESVSAGSQVGFTVTVTNGGPGTAFGATISDPLPGGDGIDWSISPAVTGCTITGTPPNETLTCAAADLASGASRSVHVVSGTAYASCGTLTNLAAAAGTNAGRVTATATTTVLCPDLTITKTAAASPVNAGADMSFTVTLSNSGKGTATNVTVSDPLPGGNGVSWSISPAVAGCSITGTVPNQTLACARDSLAPGASIAVTVTSGTMFVSCGLYPNTASASAGNFPSPITADASITVQCPAVQFTKTADADLVDAGQSIGFTITATNSGAGTATDVTIVDPLPAGDGISWTVSPANNDCSIAANVLTCSVGDLATDASFSVHVTSTTAYASCGTFANVATLTSSNNPSAQASAHTEVRCPALSIEKTADAATVDAGEQIGFTVTVSNATADGTGTASDVALNDPLPAGDGVSWSIDPAYPGPGTCSITGEVGTQVLACEFGDLARGAAASVHVVSSTQYASCGTYTNTATASAGNHPSIPASADTTVLCPDLSIVKTADADSVDAGDPIGFVVSISNSDADTTGVAKGVTISDPLPAGDGVSWTIGSQSLLRDGTFCTIAGDAPTQTLSCGPVDLQPGQSLMVHVVSDTAFASCGVYENVASLGAANAPDERSELVQTAVNCPDLSIDKVADHEAPVLAGSPIGFTVTVANAASTEGEQVGTAKGVMVNDPLPAGSGVDWALDADYTGPCTITGDPGSETLACDLGDLAAGASASVHVSSATQFASCAAYDNTATLTSTNAPTLQGSATETVLCSTLAIAKTADASVVQSGKQIGFTITASNDDTVDATGVVLTDPLPAGPDGSGVTWSIDTDATTATGCEISGDTGAQTLACELGTLAAGASVAVHIVSGTTDAACGVYNNTAKLIAVNAADETSDQAQTNVLCVLPTTASRTPTPTPTPSKSVLAVTGAGPVGAELFGALLLIAAGGVITLAATRRRRAH